MTSSCLRIKTAKPKDSLDQPLIPFQTYIWTPLLPISLSTTSPSAHNSLYPHSLSLYPLYQQSVLYEAFLEQVVNGFSCFCPCTYPFSGCIDPFMSSLAYQRLSMEKWAYRILPQHRGGRDSCPQLEMESARRRAGCGKSKSPHIFWPWGW